MQSLRMPLYSLRRLVCLLALACLSAGSAIPSTLLTNASELYVRHLNLGFFDVVNGERGYSILVPPGAEKLTVQFQTDRGATIELLAQVGLDVGFSIRTGFSTSGAEVSVYKVKPDNLGVATIEIGDRLPQRLEPGLVYIGFRSLSEGVELEGLLTATIDGGPGTLLHTVVESDFSGGMDGWTRNDVAGPYVGSKAAKRGGRIRHFAEGGNPDGYIIVTNPPGDAEGQFVAPEKFNLNLLDLDSPRFVFDLARINGGTQAHFFTEIRVFSDGGGWRWVGRPPPPLTCTDDLIRDGGLVPTSTAGDIVVPAGQTDQFVDGDADGDGDIERCFNFFQHKVLTIWQTFSVPIRIDQWKKIPGSEDGTASFETVMSNPKRIEVRASLNLIGDGTGLDNFKIVAQGAGPVRTAFPAVSAFSGGFDEWSRNYPAEAPTPNATVGDRDTQLLWAEPLSDRRFAFDAGGNPTGHLQIAETFPAGGPQPDAFVASTLFLGDYSGLSEPRFEFDYYHSSLTGDVREVAIRLFGADSVFEWTGAAPIEQWRHQVAPLREDLWVRIAGEGDFDEALANVERIEIEADLNDGFERNSLDNFALLTSDSPPFPQDIFASGQDLDFDGAATESVDARGAVEVSAQGGSLNWGATVQGPIADSISLSSTEGVTPARVEVTVDTVGLAPGVYPYDLVFTALGTTIPPAVVSGQVTLSEQPYATPSITSNGVVNAGTYRPQLAPGALGVIFGEGFNAPQQGLVAGFANERTNTLPTALNGIRVRVYATWGALLAEAPIIYADSSQINFQMPFEVLGLSEVRVTVVNGNIESQPQSVQITPQAPGVFTYMGDRAVAVNDGALNSAGNAATRVKPVTLYVTGQGAVAPELPTGRAATATPLIFTPASVRVFIGGVEADVLFAGLAPGLVGVLQINFAPGFRTPIGDQPLIVNIGGHESNVARIVIR